MRRAVAAGLGAALALAFWGTRGAEAAAMKRKTVVSIEGPAFHINGRPTYEGRSWRGMRVEGLLMNSRMVQGIFDDRNPETRAKWAYPDGPWDAERNTREFLAAMPEWRRHGLLGFTINLQGGSPQGYSRDQPWHNSAIEADGSLRVDYLGRLERILDRADDLGMAAILGYFYFGQDERVKDEAAVVRAVGAATGWLLAKGYTNVLVEINNECNVPKYEHDILKPARVHELVERVKQRSAGKVASPAGRLLASVSLGGGGIPPESIVAASDFLLLHGNGVGEPDRIRRMVDDTRARKSYRGQPILFNEDDHFDFDKPDNNMIAAVSKYAGWGYFDFRMKGEGHDEGYQSVPVNWGLSSERKRGFFGLLAEMTGAAQAKGAAGAEGAGGAAGRGPRGVAGAPGDAGPSGAAPARLETAALAFGVAPDTGAWQVTDKAAGVTWRQGGARPRFGQAMIRVGGKPTAFALGACRAAPAGGGLDLDFRPVPDRPDAWLRVGVRPAAGGQALDFSYAAAEGLDVESVRLLEDALATSAEERGGVLIPVREGLLIPADAAKVFSHTFDTYAYEGCHMAMAAALKAGAAAMVTWEDPYTAVEVRGLAADAAQGRPSPTLLVSLVLRRSARGARLHLLGRGDAGTIAAAYREVAKARGWLVTWDEKLRGHPDRAKYFGAVNFKLWSTLHRKMSEDSSKEELVRVNWTFEEAARIAEHLKTDLKLDRVLFILGGWIHRGYDNQHPDILPTAPECGGDAAFAEACRRVRACGYVLSLHDNYQDIYRDSPSWDERYVMKRPDGSLAKGGHWAGGVAYLTCAKMALDLAKRPQNLPAVRKLSGADSYFIDTTYAAGLQECFDPAHPLTRADDMKWKQALSDYAREVFGSFGSECGREWAVPHADFFEGLTGVSGTFYHDKGLMAKLGALPVPLFEMVYRDCLAMYGKYGYDINQAAEYVLNHVLLGRPMHYHSVPQHLYWEGWTGKAEVVAVAPQAAEVRPAGPRRFEITYAWDVEKAVTGDWAVFVHFTDRAGREIKFQNDHAPAPATSAWPVGRLRDGPFTVTVPPGLEGEFDVRVGFYAKPSLGRVSLLGESDTERRYVVGRLKVAGDQVTFTPVTPGRGGGGADPALFTRADGGWAEGMHPMDVFVKNTYEVLSPLNELTSRVRMTGYEFVTPDRQVRRSVFGEGEAAVEAVVNLGSAAHTRASRLGGEVVLPPGGFLVEGPAFAAFCATAFGGLRYEGPTLFALRSLDGKPLAESARIRVYHGFGDPRLRLRGQERRVEREAVVEAR